MGVPDRLPAVTPSTLRFAAPDGVGLGAWHWSPAAPRGAVLICPATGVAARYYLRYGNFLASRGYAALALDYRGIGLSRPARLAGFRATKFDWGNLDCEGALRQLQALHPGLPLYGVGHSIGGFAIGLAPSAARLRRLFLVGSQYAYWRDYAAPVRLPYFLKWHFFMPLAAGLLGYFPGRCLGWLEDLPRGVALEWGTRYHPDFRRFYRWLPHAVPPAPPEALAERLAAFRGEILAFAMADDPYATEAATWRLLAWYRGGRACCARLAPASVPEGTVGHFGFFHDRFRERLWPGSLEWLERGSAPWPVSVAGV